MDDKIQVALVFRQIQFKMRNLVKNPEYSDFETIKNSNLDFRIILQHSLNFPKLVHTSRYQREQLTLLCPIIHSYLGSHLSTKILPKHVFTKFKQMSMFVDQNVPDYRSELAVFCLENKLIKWNHNKLFDSPLQDGSTKTLVQGK